MCEQCSGRNFKLLRREFLYSAGAAAAGMAWRSGLVMGAAEAVKVGDKEKTPAFVRAAFFYPSTESLNQAGYYSWPGSGFDAEGHQRRYSEKIAEIGKQLKMNVVVDDRAICEQDEITRFIKQVQETKPDGLLLVAFKKSEWNAIARVVRETGIPTVAVATLGVLLHENINQLHCESGVYTISSLDNFDAIAFGLRMIRTASWLRQARILSIIGEQPNEDREPHFGTSIRVVPTQAVIEAFESIPRDGRVREIAREYMSQAKERREPGEEDVLEAARAYVALRNLLEREQADVLMMECLGPLRTGRFVAPCMGFMSLRDAGIVAGCQNDLDATMTMILMQQLFGRPSFQQNPAFDSENNTYFAAHCTCPRKMHGLDGPAEPYILRNHAEAGTGVVPQVLFNEGQEVTVADYMSAAEPKMSIYSGKIVACLDSPPAGGCRTNVVVKLDDADPSQMKVGPRGHMTMCYGNHARQLRTFCQMYRIGALS